MYRGSSYRGGSEGGREGGRKDVVLSERFSFRAIENGPRDKFLLRTRSVYADADDAVVCFRSSFATEPTSETITGAE